MLRKQMSHVLVVEFLMGFGNGGLDGTEFFDGF